MSASEQLLAFLLLYGLPVLFACTAFCSLGVPMPGISLLLVASGAYAEQGEWSLWNVLLGTSCAAVGGDLAGFFLSRQAGSWRVLGWAGRVGLGENFRKAMVWQPGSQAVALFLTRWLVPLGPIVNIRCGLSDYPWHRFLLWSALGQSLWVLIYVLPGYFFSDRIEELAGILADLSWSTIGLLVVVVLIGQIWKASRGTPSACSGQISAEATGPSRDSGCAPRVPSSLPGGFQD